MPPSEHPTKDIGIKLRKLAFLMDRIAAQTLHEQADLTFAEFGLLRWLRHVDRLSQKRIASFHGLTEAAVSRQIDRLVRKKLITRRVNPANRREHVLQLTPGGAKKAQAARAVIDAKFNELFKVLSSKQKDDLRHNLDLLLSSIWEEGKRIFCGPQWHPVQGKKS